MSLLSTLAKVAIGVAVAKGVSGMAAGRRTAAAVFLAVNCPLVTAPRAAAVWAIF